MAKLKFYEDPEVTKVEYDFSDRIAASQCKDMPEPTVIEEEDKVYW